MADDGQKTEEPTQRRLDEAHRRGEAPSSGEVRHAVTFAAAAVIVGALGGGAVIGIGRASMRLWQDANDFTMDAQGARSLVTGVAAHFALSLWPVMALLLAAAAVAGAIQGPPSMNWARVAPKWSKVSPFAGWNRLFGTRSLIEFIKTVAKFAVVAGIALWFAWPHAIAFDGLIGASPGHLTRAAQEIVLRMLKAAAIAVGLLAVADILYQRHAFTRRLRMTFKELYDEIKDSEGDPKIKARIRAIGQARSRRRMMAAVPKAAVVITNPTHYAIALEYRHGEMGAPIVVAKGVDALALRIRAVAEEAGVPIVESPPLARALHASAEIDRPMPTEHYAAVAEIIGYVLRLARQAGIAAK